MGLAAIYMLPAAVEQRWAAISQLTSDPGEKIENSWLFARHADPYLADHDVILHRVSLLGATMLAVALAGLIVAWKRGSLRGRRAWWMPLAMIPLAVLFLQIPLSLPVWNLLPKLRFLQFPWRWLVVLEAPMALFVAAAVWSARGWRRVAVVGLCGALLAAAPVAAAAYFFQVCDDEDAVDAMVAVYRTGAGFGGVSEYAPPGADSTLMPTGLPGACLVADPSAELAILPENAPDDAIPEWQAEQGTCMATFDLASDPAKDSPGHLRLTALVADSGYVVLRLRAYPAWRVAVNGRPVTSLPNREDGLVAIPAAPGPVDLSVDWIDTPDVISGRWLTALAVLLLTGLCLLERRLSRPRLS
jgi:hypothetical protein